MHQKFDIQNSIQLCYSLTVGPKFGWSFPRYLKISILIPNFSILNPYIVHVALFIFTSVSNDLPEQTHKEAALYIQLYMQHKFPGSDFFSFFKKMSVKTGQVLPLIQQQRQ